MQFLVGKSREALFTLRGKAMAHHQLFKRNPTHTTVVSRLASSSEREREEEEEGMEEAVKFLWTMLKEALLLLASLGREAVVWFGRLLAPENLKQGWHAAEKSCAVAVAWFDEVLPPETRAEKIKQWRLAVENLGAAAWAWFVGRPYLVAAVAVYVMYGFGLCGWFGMVKMMKAPGMGFMIPRIIFQTFPKWYFRIFRPR